MSKWPLLHLRPAALLGLILTGTPALAAEPAAETTRLQHVASLTDRGHLYSRFEQLRTDQRNVLWESIIDLKRSGDPGARRLRLTRIDNHCQSVAREHSREAAAVCDNLEVLLLPDRMEGWFNSAWSDFSFQFVLTPDREDREVWRLQPTGALYAPGLAVRIRPQDEMLRVLWLMQDQGRHRNYGEITRAQLRTLDLADREFALLVAMDLLADAADFGVPGRLKLPATPRTAFAKTSGALDIMGTPIECTGVGGQFEEFCTPEIEHGRCAGEAAFCDFCGKLPGNGFVLEVCGGGTGGGLGGTGGSGGGGVVVTPTPMPDLRPLGFFRHPRIINRVVDSTGRTEITLEGGFANRGDADVSVATRVFWNSVPDDPPQPPHYASWADWDTKTGPPSFGRCADGSHSLASLSSGRDADADGFFICDPTDFAAIVGKHRITFEVDARKDVAEQNEGNNFGTARGTYIMVRP